MRVAGMSPSGADMFRRAMTRHLNHVEMSSLEGDFVNGCLANDVPREVADMLFAAVQGFAVYGFCRSHAAAFARTAYETAWLKLNHAGEVGCGAPHQPADGLLSPERAGRRPEAAWGDGAAGGRQPLRRPLPARSAERRGQK